MVRLAGVGIVAADELGLCDVLVDKGLLKHKAVKILSNTGSGSFDWVKNAIAAERSDDLAIKQSGGFVVWNGSFGGGSSLIDNVEAELKKSTEAGIFFCFAAGNTGQVGVNYPGNGKYSIACASLDQSGVRSSYSTMGPEVWAAMPGRKFPELEMALKFDLTPCDFKDPDYWVRGIADLVIVHDENLTARVFDYKSGSDKYPDTDQLTLMSLLIFKHFPEVRYVTSGLLFVLKNSVVKHKVDKEQETILWWKYRERIIRLAMAHATGVWNPTQSGLCRKHCPVLDCHFNGRN